MRDFFIALANGVAKNETNQREKELLRNMELVGATTLYKGVYYLKDGFYCGRIDISKTGNGYVRVFGDKFQEDILVEKKYLNEINLGDIVLIKTLTKKRGRVCAKIAMLLKPAFATSIVYTKKVGKEIVGINIKTALARNLKASLKSLKMLDEMTLLKIDNFSNEIIEVIGSLFDENVDEKISLGLYNKHESFPHECEQEADAYKDSVDTDFYKERVDLRELDFCTIDPVDAKDFDDAIYYDVKNRILYVAIADVSEYVTAYSAIDKEAKFRGFSIYLPHKSIPMLPPILSQNLCSLKPNEDRLAFCFKISFDKNNNVIKEEPISAIINSKARLNYDEVDEFLDGKATNKNQPFWLKTLFTLAQEIKKERLKKGFDFKSKELRMELNEDGSLKSTRFETSSPSHSLIEESMLLANKAAAKIVAPRGIFRNHEKADFKKFELLLNDLSGFGIDVKFNYDLCKLVKSIQAKADSLGIREEIDKLIIKSQKKAGYGGENRGHFGLGFDLYSHFTSPIRRYSDLHLHRLLKAKLNNDEKLFDYLLLNIEESCNLLNELEREADKVAFDFMDRKFARWAAKNIGKNFRCYIDSNQNLTIAKLDDEIKGATIFITNYEGELLEKVLVCIADVDIAAAKIYARVVKRLDV